MKVIFCFILFLNFSLVRILHKLKFDKNKSLLNFSVFIFAKLIRKTPEVKEERENII